MLADQLKAMVGSLQLIVVMIAIFAGGWAGWHWLHAGKESTDDAQVEDRIVNIAPRVPGQVAKVNVIDNQVVAAGKVDSIAGATGARFALIPPDNATGTSSRSCSASWC
jgi:multidrug resistance efflux pump